MNTCLRIWFRGTLALALAGIVPAAPITLHPKNPHYFLFRGKAIAIVGSGEHYGAVLNADFDYHRYLTTIEAAKLNYTRLFVGAYVEVPAKSFGILRNDLAPAPGKFTAPWTRSQTPGYAGGGNKFDLENWDTAFFKRYRDFLAEAAKRGIVVEVTLFSSHYNETQWEISAFNPANNVNATGPVEWKKVQTLENGNILNYQERYTRRLVREANEFDNVIFEIQNEPWSDQPAPVDVVNPYLQPPARDRYPNVVEVADGFSIAWQQRVAEWIATEETTLPNKHLIAQNYCNFRFPVRELLTGVSVVNYHYAYPEAVTFNYGLGKALSYDETGFLGHDDASYRRQAWNFMLSGGSTFDHLDYSFSVGHEDGTDTAPNGPGGGSPALRQQLGVLHEFLESFSLVDLKPDAETVKHAAGVTARVLSNPGHEYAIYLDGSGQTEVTLRLPEGEYLCEWINTVSGAIDKTERFHHAGGEKVLSTPDFQNGVVSRLKRAGK